MTRGLEDDFPIKFPIEYGEYDDFPIKFPIEYGEYDDFPIKFPIEYGEYDDFPIKYPIEYGEYGHFPVFPGFHLKLERCNDDLPRIHLMFGMSRDMAQTESGFSDTLLGGEDPQLCLLIYKPMNLRLYHVII